MNKCRECGRPLNKDENDLCPACESNKSYKKKRRGEIIGGALAIVGAIVRIIRVVLTGGKGGGKA